MTKHHFMVIGNGPAGNQAALTLRDMDAEARITLISKHRGGSYKPNLLPHLISGEISEEAIYVFSPSSYKDKDITLRNGQEVVDIDLNKREITFDHKEVTPFDGLIIAAGATPRIPERMSVFQDLMLTLKTPEDAAAWSEKLQKAQSVLMIGGDLTSLAFTKALISMGKEIFFALDEEAFWPIRFTPQLAEDVSAQLAARGVHVLKNPTVKSISHLPNGGVEVDMGEQKICVGLIGAFFGLVPDVRFAARSGLTLDRGILVDEYLETGFEGVYATGDCAQIYHPRIRDYWISIGHENAVHLGKIAAMNLIGARVKTEVTRECIFEVHGIHVNTSWWAGF